MQPDGMLAYATQRSIQEAVAAINAMDPRAARAHEIMTRLHVAKATWIMRTAASQQSCA